MTSLISSLSSGLIAINFYNKIFSSKEFIDFNKNINQKNSEHNFKHFFRNLFFVNIDPYVHELLENDEFNSIFKNENLTKHEQAKLYLGKVISNLYDKYSDIFKDYFYIEKQIIIEYFISFVNQINLDKIINGNDIYILLIDKYSDILKDFFKNNIYEQLFKDINEDTSLIIINFLLKHFNNIYEYQSKYIDNNLINIEDSLHINKKRTFEEINKNKIINSNKKPKI